MIIYWDSIIFGAIAGAVLSKLCNLGLKDWQFYVALVTLCTAHVVLL